MNSYSDISLISNLFAPDLLDRVLTKREEGCTDKDSTAFMLLAGLSVPSEIARAYTIARTSWDEYCLRGKNVNTLVTRLLGAFGFEYRATKDFVWAGYGENALPYAISGFAGASGQDKSIPVLIVPADQDLDRPLPDEFEARHKSPHQLMQQFLNAEDAYLWAIVTNGETWRLLRDNPALSRPCYLEVDMGNIISSNYVGEFDGLWRLLHASRSAGDKPEDCRWEKWHRAVQEAGLRVREGLREGVENAIATLGAAFISHPYNDALRSALADGSLSSMGYYSELQRMVYRLIFLSVLEERELLHAHAPHLKKEAALYHCGYSIARLVQPALRADEQDARFFDLWEAQKIVFTHLGGDRKLNALALPALGGLYTATQCRFLSACRLSNRAFLQALYCLRWTVINGQRMRVDYRFMGAEELGSVYESLLELTPSVSVADRTFAFVNVGGNKRKTTGSYYTPKCLVDELVKSALVPLVEERIKGKSAQEVERAILKLKVIDPACGSGHFLIAAAHKLAEYLADARSEDSHTTEEVYHNAIHDVIRKCIYGVDCTPMAVELVRMNLWLEGYQPGKPLSFLDSHLQCGNSLLGVFSAETLKHPIPDDAFKPLAGDSKAVCSALKKGNARERKYWEVPMLSWKAPTPSNDGQEEENSPADVRKMAERWASSRRIVEDSPLALAADVWVGAFLLPKTEGAEIPTSGTITQLSMKLLPPAAIAARAACRKANVLHWFLRFPEVWNADGKGGFDCVLGNPPWEKNKVQQQEWFAPRYPEIADAAKQKRQKYIDLLAEGMLGHYLHGTDGDPIPAEIHLFHEFNSALRNAATSSVFTHVSGDDAGRFPLTGMGDVNLFALFAETNLSLLASRGKAGMIVPTNIATDAGTAPFFRHISASGSLVSLYDIENREKLFPAVDSRQRFCCLTLGRAKMADLAFFLTNTDQLDDKRRHFSLSPDDFRAINPNTCTCPVLRCQKDAELISKIYSRIPVLMDEQQGTNPWGIGFCRLFDMTNDSGLFHDTKGLNRLPLYEGKLIHHYDHRWATFVGAGDSAKERDVSPEEKENPAYEIKPRYWVNRSDVQNKLPDGYKDRQWLLGFRNVTNATNERTFICSFIPCSAVGNSTPLILTLEKLKFQTCLVANLSSLVLDYVVRNKVGGVNMNFFYVQQFPVLPPETYTCKLQNYISKRVLELTYTSESMRPFAEELGYTGEPFTFDVDRRAKLRAELDAVMARLYGLTREELEYILEPEPFFEEGDCPTVTFPGLRNNELKAYHEYRTKRLVLAAWDALETSELWT